MEHGSLEFSDFEFVFAFIIGCIYKLKFKLVNKWYHFNVNPTLRAPIGKLWMWIMAERGIQNLHSK